jgi:hypothetical protein
MIVLVIIDGCSQDQFTCGNGVCIHVSLVCNFIQDCADNSDEQCGDYLYTSISVGKMSRAMTKPTFSLSLIRIHAVRYQFIYLLYGL